MAAKKTVRKTATASDASFDDSVKNVAKKAAKKAAPAKTSPKEAKQTAPSIEAIARGAYLNYRSRVEQGLPGDSHGDWLHAEYQLRQED